MTTTITTKEKRREEKKGSAYSWDRNGNGKFDSAVVGYVLAHVLALVPLAQVINGLACGVQHCDGESCVNIQFILLNPCVVFFSFISFFFVVLLQQGRSKEG